MGKVGRAKVLNALKEIFYGYYLTYNAAESLSFFYPVSSHKRIKQDASHVRQLPKSLPTML